MASPRRSPRLRADAAFPDLVEAWLDHLSWSQTARATLVAYRSDLLGVAQLMAADVGGLRLEHLTKRALQAAFASWTADHAVVSVRRAHSCWSGFFNFLVAEDVCEGNPMAAVSKPRKSPDAPRAIRDPESTSRLLASAAQADPSARDPWPERDLALVATFCVTGVRSAEATALGTTSLCGPAGNRTLVVVGRGGRPRSIPVDHALEEVLKAYVATRTARFPSHDLGDSTTPLFVDVRGRRLSADQMKYLVERLYVRAGLRDRVPRGALLHALRHTFAISAAEAGVDVVGLQALLGHASLETTRRYIDTTSEGLREVIDDHPGQVALRRHVEARASSGRAGSAD